MRIQRVPALIVLLTLLIPFGFSGCSDDETDKPQVGDAIPPTPDAVETWFNTNKDTPDALVQVFNKVAGQLHGTPDDSIEWTGTGGGSYTGSVGVDLDMDGEDDCRVHGTSTLTRLKTKGHRLEAAANFTVTGVTGADMTMTDTGSAEVLGGGEEPTIFGFGGQFAVNHDDGSSVEITEMYVNVDVTFPASPFLNGYLCFTCRGGGTTGHGTLYFADNGTGGWYMRVVGEGWNFAVP